jgi:hypothetical protein
MPVITRQRYIMAATPRMIFVPTAPQRAFLKAESERLDISVSDLVRRILDAHLDARQPERGHRFLRDTNEGASK